MCQDGKQRQRKCNLRAFVVSRECRVFCYNPFVAQAAYPFFSFKIGSSDNMEMEEYFQLIGAFDLDRRLGDS